MPDLITNSTLEAFAEAQVATLIRAQVSTVDDADIVTAHGERTPTDERPHLTVTVNRLEMEPPLSGWWLCEISVAIDPAGKSSEWRDAIGLAVETAIGNNDGNLETELTTGRLVCMAGSASYGSPTEIEAEDGRVFYSQTANFGLLAPS